MRVLYYNWVDYLDDESRGGGVSVYQANLMAGLQDQPGIEAEFLCAGLSHDLLDSAPRWERMRHGPKGAPPRYEIVNSGCLSPSHHSFGNAAQVTHPATEAVFADFLRQHGPFDVVHFNNLEGLPANVLALRAQFPDTAFVLSLHNYYPFCPQVNLWFEERETCADFAGGAKCITCLEHKPAEPLVRKANAMAYRLKRSGVRPGTPAFDLTMKSALRGGMIASRTVGRLRRKAAPAADQTGSAAAAQGFADRRARMLELINTHCDRVLCVSDRVGQIAIHHGLRAELVQTSYIGSRQAARFAQTRPRPSLLGADGTLTLGYLGYMRRDKGFYFLLDALESLPPALAGRVRLLAAAGQRKDSPMDRLRALNGHLAGVTHVDGYGHDDLDDLLAQVDVGLVPVMWEDNLPQVAIEMHARHIPLLTSDLGGAQELARCPDMVFRAGDTASFADRVAFLLQGGPDPDRYWAGAMAPVSMQGHLDQLITVYREVSRAQAAAALS